MSRKILFVILILAVILNLIGAFIPETGFDALWYHLTIPRLYEIAGKIYHIPGGLFYYSEMPRLTEIVYMFIHPQLLSWFVGVATAYLLYRYTRSTLATVIWYVTPLVGWLSGSAYIDLSRTFFEFLAFILVFNHPMLAGIAIGLAISTKTLAIGSLVPLLILVKNRRKFLIPCFLVIIPWLFASYLNTGYPFYPIGAGILDATHIPTFNVFDLYKLWLDPQDPISPIYLLVLPFMFNKHHLKLKIYVLLTALIWFVTPRTGGGRFILPYLPVWAILAATVIKNNKILIYTLIFVSLINFFYRVGTMSKAFPYLLGKETKDQYLCKNLDLGSTYYLCPGKTPGVHNLYYYYQ